MIIINFLCYSKLFIFLAILFLYHNLTVILVKIINLCVFELKGNIFPILMFEYTYFFIEYLKTPYLKQLWSFKVNTLWRNWTRFWVFFYYNIYKTFLLDSLEILEHSLSSEFEDNQTKYLLWVVYFPVFFYSL